uniref:Uncharacterized protein n=1 Tax=Steinernema glaseri TaxID=37863 RepID=A0A1I8ASS7_9BILA
MLSGAKGLLLGSRFWAIAIGREMHFRENPRAEVSKTRRDFFERKNDPRAVDSGYQISTRSGYPFFFNPVGISTTIVKEGNGHSRLDKDKQTSLSTFVSSCTARLVPLPRTFSFREQRWMELKPHLEPSMWESTVGFELLERSRE